MNNVIKTGSIIGLSATILGALTMMCQVNSKLGDNSNSNISLVRHIIKNESQYSQFVNNLVLAQAILESNLSVKPSKLAIDDNNLFGIKCSTKVDKCTTYKTIEYVKGKKLVVNASFAHFESIEDCIRLRLAMFKMLRYQNVTKCVSFSDCATRIQKSGYATDPSYSKQLIRIYEDYIK